MPDAPLPPGATRCREAAPATAKTPAPACSHPGPTPAPTARIVSQRCTVCGHEYVDVPRDMAGQEIRPEAAR